LPMVANYFARLRFWPYEERGHLQNAREDG
jgi:hypothetical protein